MTKTEHQQHRQHVLNLVYPLVKLSKKTPSYQKAVAYLNAKEIQTARGNNWTRKRLFRFLQNAGYSGLWGLRQLDHAPTLKGISGTVRA